MTASVRDEAARRRWLINDLGELAEQLPTRQFAAGMIAFSGPVDWTCFGSEPNLVPAEFDDAATAEPAYERHLASLGRMDEEG